MTTFTSYSTSVTYTVEVHEAEPIQLPYGSTRFRPVRATITFLNGEFRSLKTEGPNVKKDGSDGQNYHDASWGYSSFERQRMPSWAEELVEETAAAAKASADRGPF